MEVRLDDSNFKKEVLDSDIPVLVDFWAEWCYPCRMVAPAVEEIAKEYQGKLKVCKVNVDEARQTAANYGIMSIPTISVFKGGKVMEQIVGAVPKAALEKKIKPYIS
jgi:thioredoxin 1